MYELINNKYIYVQWFIIYRVLESCDTLCLVIAIIPTKGIISQLFHLRVIANWLRYNRNFDTSYSDWRQTFNITIIHLGTELRTYFNRSEYSIHQIRKQRAFTVQYYCQRFQFFHFLNYAIHDKQFLCK